MTDARLTRVIVAMRPPEECSHPRNFDDEWDIGWLTCSECGLRHRGRPNPFLQHYFDKAAKPPEFLVESPSPYFESYLEEYFKNDPMPLGPFEWMKGKKP